MKYLQTLFGSVIAYLMIGFIFNNYNAAEWSVGVRFILVVITIFIFVVLLGSQSVGTNNNEPYE